MTKQLKASDFERVAGSARQYRNKRTGEIVSRRQHDKLTRTGGKSFERFAKERAASGQKNPMERYNNLLRVRKELVEQETGERTTLGAIRRSDEFKKAIKDLRSRDKSATGPKARALVKLGLRDKSWTHAVGDTPTTARTPARMLGESKATPEELRAASRERKRSKSKRETRKGRA